MSAPPCGLQSDHFEKPGPEGFLSSSLIGCNCAGGSFPWRLIRGGPPVFFVPTSVSLIIAPESPPPLASTMAAPKSDHSPKPRCTCLPKIEGPDIDAEENYVTTIRLSARTSLIGTWPNSCSPDSSLRCLNLFNLRTYCDLGDTTWSQVLLRVPQARAVFQRWTRITARPTDRASYRGNRYLGTSECEAA